MTWEAQVIRVPDSRATEPAALEPLGLASLDAARALVDAAFSPNTWTDPYGALFDGDGFSLQIRIAVRLDTLMIEAWGQGNPVPLLVHFAASHGWVILDTAEWTILPSGSTMAPGWTKHLAQEPRSEHP